MTTPEWIVKRPADLIADAEELLQTPIQDRGVAWFDQWRAATEEAVHLVENSIRSAPRMNDAVPVAFPPGDPAKTALFMALELQASQRVAVTRTCRHAPVYAHEAQENPDRSAVPVSGPRRPVHVRLQ
jgi:hypothetical protein